MASSREQAVRRGPGSYKAADRAAEPYELDGPGTYEVKLTLGGLKPIEV